MSHTRSISRFALLALGLLAILVIQRAGVVRAAPTDLFISEYIEGSSNNKALEIYNGTGTAVNLSTGGYEIFISFNGGSSTATFALTGTVANGDVYVFAASTANATILAQADQTTASGLWNGDDFIALRKTGAVVVDSFGVLGTDPGTEWGTGLTSTADNTLQRKDTICAGDTITGDAFDPSIEWNGFAVDTFTGLGSHTASCGSGDIPPTVTSTSPLDNATNVAANTNISITFSELVNVTGTILVSGASSGAQNLSPTTGDNLTFTLDPADFTAGEVVTVTVLATQVADQDGTPDNMAANYVFDFTILIPPSVCGDPATPIHDVQGNGAASPFDGLTKTVEAVVVGDFQDTTADPPNELNGFFLQEEDADIDADPNTSEGIFVFDGTNPATPAVAVGDKVRVTGTVDEFGDAPDTYTEIVGPLTVQVCSTGNTLPTPASVDLPVTALSDYEKIESMSVSFVDELTVSEIFTLGRFGEVLLSEGGRLPSPTHVAEPGAPAQAVRDANILRSITLDDGLTNQNPDPVLYPEPGGLSALNTLRGGDTTTGLTGVMHYLDTTEDYRIQPTGTVTWSHDNPRPASPPVITGTLKIVGSNTLNFFTSLDLGPDICGPLNNQECRGADSASEFTRQRDKLLNMLAALNADIVGLNELENNSSSNPANNGDDVVLESIVNGLNALLGAGTYDFIDTGTMGGDAIKVGLIYKPATVTPVGAFAVLDSTVDPTFIDTRSRPVLAQTFEQIATGEQLTVAVNHLKSKGSACTPDDPDTGDLAGNCNLTRTAAAEAEVNWLATDPTGSGDPDFLIVGDLNSYAKEDPIDALLAGGFTDLAEAFNADPYSYVFDGEWGYLDYALSSASLTPQVTSATEWHINADEPIVLDYNVEFKSAGQITGFYDPAAFRVSDHDPMVVGLTLDSVAPDTTITANPLNPTNSNSGTFEYESSEGGDQFECELDGDGDDWFDCDGGQATPSGLTDGSHTFKVRAIDAAGNVDPTPDSYTWVIDTTAPDTTITGNPPNPSNSSIASFNFNGTDGGTGVSSFQCNLDNVLWVPCASPQTYTSMTDDTHIFQVRACDGVGNCDATPASYTWTIDTIPPDVSIDQAGTQADPTSTSPIHFTVVFSEPVTGFGAGDVALSGSALPASFVATEIAPMDGTTYDVAVSGMTVSGTVVATVLANSAQDTASNFNVASTSTDNTVTYELPLVSTAVFVSTTAAGTVGALSFGSEDIIMWDGSAWSLRFDGSAAGLTASKAKHNINAFYLEPDSPFTLMSFTQNARTVPGIFGKVDGMDLVVWDGSQFILVFDGQDVGLTNKTAEKIDGVHLLPGDQTPPELLASAGGYCQVYLLISTQGPGKVPNYSGGTLNFSGEDVLGFCVTSNGDNTSGKWIMVLDGSAQGMPKNSTGDFSLSDDGQTLYLTTKGAFNVDSAVGGHSMVYAYDLGTQTFSGPLFIAADEGLAQKVDGMQVEGDLP